MKLVKEFVIEDQDIIDRLSALDYEIEARKSAITTMIENNIAKSSPEAFKIYHDEYVKFMKEYKELQNQITMKYTPDELRQHSFRWNLNYSDRTIKFTQSCDCEDLSIPCCE